MSHSAFQHRVRLKVLGLTKDTAELASNALKAFATVDQVTCHIKKGILAFRYDASELTLDDCIQLLNALSITLDQRTLWQRMVSSWAFQVSANIRANAHHTPHCCGKAPNAQRRLPPQD